MRRTTRPGERGSAATGMMTRTKKTQRKVNAKRSPCAQRGARPRRRGLARLRSAYFSRAGQLAARYDVTIDRVITHLWRVRRLQPRAFLRHVAHVEDLVMAIACIDGCSRAWADFTELHERNLARRCRDCADELEATVQARKFIALMRRDALAGRSGLLNYAGNRPLRTWAGDAFQNARLRTRRAAFVLDPADSCCGGPLRFTPTGADG